MQKAVGLFEPYHLQEKRQQESLFRAGWIKIFGIYAEQLHKRIWKEERHASV
jgi:hypothetical protein